MNFEEEQGTLKTEIAEEKERVCVCGGGGGGDQPQIKRTHEPIDGKRNHSLIYTGQCYTRNIHKYLYIQFTYMYSLYIYTLYNVHTIHTHTHTVNPLLSHFGEPPSSLVSKPRPLNSLSLPSAPTSSWMTTVSLSCLTLVWPESYRPSPTRGAPTAPSPTLSWERWPTWPQSSLGTG